MPICMLEIHDDSAEINTPLFHCSMGQFSWCLLHFATFVFQCSGCLIAALKWSSSMEQLLVEIRFLTWSVGSVVNLGVALLWSFQTIRLRVHRSLFKRVDFIFFQKFVSKKTYFPLSQKLFLLSSSFFLLHWTLPLYSYASARQIDWSF